MSREFPLAALLRLRRLQEEQAAAELERANLDERSAARLHRETAEMLAGHTLPPHGDDAMWRGAIASRAALTAMVGEATATLDAAAEVARRAAEQWSGTRTRTSTLEKLEDRHDQGVRAEDERAEQLVLDEAATRRAVTGDPADVRDDAQHDESGADR